MDQAPDPPARIIVDLTFDDDNDDNGSAQPVTDPAKEDDGPVKQEPLEDDDGDHLFVHGDQVAMDEEFVAAPMSEEEINELFNMTSDGHAYEPVEEQSTHEEEPASGKKRKRTNKAKKPKRAAKVVEMPISAINLDNLMGTDVFQDTEATSHLQAMPEVVGGANRAQTIRRMRKDANASGRSAENTRDQKMLNTALQSFDGRQRARFVDGGVRIMGLISKLKPYQAIGTGFMRNREKANGPNDAKGGILADTMGLGKTIMMLANIVNGQPEKVRERRPTLIVAAPGILTQWNEEITKHCEVNTGTPYALRHVAFYRDLLAQRLPAKQLIKRLEAQDIVLVTYHYVSKSFPKEKPPITCVTHAQKREWFEEYFAKRRGVLHAIKWHRIVLDEAHAIKNCDSIMSRACWTLRADHFWAITGTPILNSISEFYPYLRFIRDPLVTKKAQFLRHFCNRADPDAIARLQTLIGRIMLRRTHATTMFGRRLIDLPAVRPCNEIKVDFSTFERSVYAVVQGRIVERINTVLSSNEPNKHRSILALILRLRQMTDHFYLIQGTLQDILTLADLHALQELCDRTTSDEADDDAVMAQMQLRQMLANAKKTRNDQSVNNLDQQDVSAVSMSDMNQDLLNELGLHGVEGLHAGPFLDVLRQDDTLEDIIERSKCTYCSNRPVEPHVTSCGHIYCLKCVQRLQRNAARLGYDAAKCKACATQYTTVSPCLVGTEPAGQPGEQTTAKRGKKTKMGAESKPLDWTLLGGLVVPSAKTKAMVAQVKDWLKDDANVKIIVYSQFRGMLNLLERICNTEQWKHVRYSGEMSHEARHQAIHAFADPNEGIQILVASLKCGGQGLNLTAAARVLLMDAWWNDSIEQQAFSRVYRIGQEKETQMTRLRVKNSIDDFMFMTKERKQGEIDPIMDADLEKTMNLEQMLGFLGTVKHDDQGNPYLEANPSSDDPLSELYEVNE